MFSFQDVLKKLLLSSQERLLVTMTGSSKCCCERLSTALGMVTDAKCSASKSGTARVVTWSLLSWLLASCSASRCGRLTRALLDRRIHGKWNSSSSRAIERTYCSLHQVAARLLEQMTKLLRSTQILTESFCPILCNKQSVQCLWSLPEIVEWCRVVSLLQV